MGLVSGSASFVRFGLEGELPESGLEYISERIKTFSFTDIDDTMDESSIGWVSVMNMFDNRFEYASYHVGDYIVLTVRIDERKVSPAVLKKFTVKEEERIKKERQVPRLGRTVKAEIKERVRSELVAKSMPIPSIFDVVWNLSESSVLCFTTNKKLHALLEDMFKDCFGLLLVQQIPYVTATHMLDEDDHVSLDRLVPEIFV